MRLMSRLGAPLLMLAVVAAACGGGSETTGGPSATVHPAAAVIDSTPPTSTPDGIALPDVSFTLADGSTFDFGAVDTPVMLVFWAEW
jgi:hypothetical protein